MKGGAALATPSFGGALTINGNAVGNYEYKVVNSNTTNGIVPALTNLNLIVPAGATYQLAFSGTTIQYMTLTNGAGQNTFSAGGVNIITGDGIGWAGGAYPATPVNYPRGLVGGITFISGTPCTGTPNADVTSPAINPVS